MFWHFYCVMLCRVRENAGMSLRTADSVSSGLCCSYFELGKVEQIKLKLF